MDVCSVSAIELGAALRRRERSAAEALPRLAQEGYSAFFEVDFLSDKETGELYLGELNPRVSGASSMTNVTAGAYADIPLFLFHLLEYLDVDYELDVEEINARWARTGGEDIWSQLIIKATSDEVELITAALMTGVYKLDEHGRIAFARWANDWHNLIDESEAFYLRVAAAGDYRYKGADLGVLVTRGRLQTDDDRLTDRCRDWIDGITSQFAGTPVTPADATPLAGTTLKSGYEVA